MRIAVLLPIGRMDKYGYQYDDLTRIIVENLVNFSDHLLVVSSSRYIKKELFENKKIELISNEKTWFKLINREEIFSWEVLANMLDFGCQILKEEGYDVAIQIHINQYIPKSSENNIKKSMQKMLDENESFTWRYKAYQCGNLIFNSDRKNPWIINLTKKINYKFVPDGIVHKETKELVRMHNGNFKKYNNQAIRDNPWECTLQDILEKHKYVLHEWKRFYDNYDPNQVKIPKFDEKEYIVNSQNKMNKKKRSNIQIDEIGEKILKIRRKDFIANILEVNYNYIKPNRIKNILNKLI